MNSEAQVLAGTYDVPLVILSIVIAIFAAGAALDLAGRVTPARGSARLAWLTGGAFAMGTGIWSMHYIGMLAFQLPIPVQYDWPIVLLSLLAAMLASWVSLFVVSRRSMRGQHAALGSIFMGCGIAAMHYIGMEAMRLSAMHRYSPGLVALSVALAIVIAYVALRLTFSLRTTMQWGWRKIGAAITMGAAIPVMHYVGMAAVTFVPDPTHIVDHSHAIAISQLGVVSIALVALVVLGLVFLTAALDRRFTAQATQLQSTEYRYRLIVETASDAFLEFTREGRITEWNAHAVELFGWSHAEALERTVLDLLASEADRQRLQSLLDSNRDPLQSRMEVAARARDGRIFPVETTLSPIRVGEQLSFAAFAHDVTQRKLTEAEQERAKSAAEAGSRAKSEFLANMSHEIRTPMNGVIGMAELLLDTPLTPTQREYAETIRDSSTALLTIINDILDFSKVEAGKLELELVDMSLRDTAEDVARLLAIQAHAKDLELTLQVDPRVPSTVCGDAGRVRQILLNLGSNAIKFTSSGEVSIEMQLVESQADGTLVRCEVRDTGIGIPENRIPALFAPFSQADASTTRKFGGTGLGLSIVRRLVELMHGETGASSTVGVGSTFWFTARFGHASKAPATSHYPAVQLQGRRILVVDDHATNRTILAEFVQAYGAVPTTTRSASEALTAMREAQHAGKPFDAALIDQRMPDGDGAQLGRAINADPSLRNTRLILLTSSGQRGDGKRFAELGFAGYLLKPVSQRECIAALTLSLATPAEAWHMQSQPIITQQALQLHRSQLRNRVLLAEDNIVNQKVAIRLLEKLDYRVTAVADGRAAVDAWQRGDFDLILMDCQMPELDGYEATREIRRLEALDAAAKRMPIIALTADALKGTEAQCLAAGMTGYLTKPIDRALLARTLADALSEAQPRSRTA